MSDYSDKESGLMSAQSTEPLSNFFTWIVTMTPRFAIMLNNVLGYSKCLLVGEIS